MNENINQFVITVIQTVINPNNTREQNRMELKLLFNPRFEF